MSDKGVSAVIGMLLMVAITVAIAATIYFYITEVWDDDSCVSDGRSFTKTGVVVDVMFLGDCNMITFDDGSVLYLHGSSNEKYDLYELESLLAMGVNYSFSYHHECVMSDGNDVYYHQGNVIDRIKVNQ